MILKHRKKIIIAGMYIVFCLILLFAISKKEDYHVDEVFSYGLANHQSDGAASMRVKKGKIFEDPLKPYHKYMTVNKKHKFDYKSVWENQKNDVHPPLYYVILHTICSFFPGRFSRWFAGIINIGFAVLTLFMIRKMVLYLTEDESVCLLLSAGFVLNSGIISSVTFFRMYVMTMFWCVVLAYLFLHMMKEPVFKKVLAMVYITTVLSALTHYYCIIFVVLLSVAFGVYLLAQKQWKRLVIFCSVMAAAAGTTVIIFPGMIKHIFAGYRGKGAIENLQNGADYWIRIKNFFGFANIQLFGNQLGYIILILVFVGIYACYQNGKMNKDSKQGAKSVGQYVLLLFPLIVYFFLVSKMAAFQADRYLFPVYGVAYVVFLCGINHVFKHSFSKQQRLVLLCVLLAFMTYGSWKNIGWPYLYQGTDERIEALKIYSDVDCVFIHSKRFQTQYKYREVACYDSVTFVKDNDLSKLADYEEECNELIVIINSPNSHESYLNEIMKKYPALTKYVVIQGAGEGVSYYLSGS